MVKLDLDLDPDPHSEKLLDPDPHIECGSGSRRENECGSLIPDPDPQPWWRGRDGKS